MNCQNLKGNRAYPSVSLKTSLSPWEQWQARRAGQQSRESESVGEGGKTYRTALHWPALRERERWEDLGVAADIVSFPCSI